MKAELAEMQIQRAHDLLLHVIMDEKLRESFHPGMGAVMVAGLDALCWVLGHDHNRHFAALLTQVEEELRKRGIDLIELPEMVYPDKTRGSQ